MTRASLTSKRSEINLNDSTSTDKFYHFRMSSVDSITQDKLVIQRNTDKKASIMSALDYG